MKRKRRESGKTLVANAATCLVPMRTASLAFRLENFHWFCYESTPIIPNLCYEKSRSSSRDFSVFWKFCGEIESACSLYRFCVVKSVALCIHEIIFQYFHILHHNVILYCCIKTITIDVQGEIFIKPYSIMVCRFVFTYTSKVILELKSVGS